MLSLPSPVRIFLCRVPVDMRWSFDRLAALASSRLNENPLSGHLFVFCSRRSDRVKILYWDRDGYALWYKRLEQGTFLLPPGEDPSLTAAGLQALLEGLAVSPVPQKNRYRPPFSP